MAPHDDRRRRRQRATEAEKPERQRQPSRFSENGRRRRRGDTVVGADVSAQTQTRTAGPGRRSVPADRRRIVPYMRIRAGGRREPDQARASSATPITCACSPARRSSSWSAAKRRAIAPTSCG